jgi:hypothetical protein
VGIAKIALQSILARSAVLIPSRTADRASCAIFEGRFFARAMPNPDLESMEAPG